MRQALDQRADGLGDAEAVARHDASVYGLRQRRDAAVAQVPDWDKLRDHAAAVKRHVLDHLDLLLERFEGAASAAGAELHWALDASAHNRIVHGILARRGVQRVVKSKSMLTEECGLNEHLEAQGIGVIDTDLGERIVQLAAEPPSHIVVPAVHRSRAEVGALFERNLQAPPGETDPEALTHHARRDLRTRFLEAEAGISGANFALAESGSIVIVTNEGNADLGNQLPPLHIACIGIEKLLPSADDLPVFLRLLARSATGQAISAYTSVLTGPRPGGELHIVLVDNGRSELLARAEHRSALACIRCGACLNTCPVYRRAGGHAYAQPIPGPLGAVLAPALRPGPDARALPLASTLCGSCTAVCPVRIDLHDQLLAWRREARVTTRFAGLGLALAAAVLARPWLYRLAGRLARLAWPLLARPWRGNPLQAWLQVRELPQHPGASFAARHRRGEGRRP